MQTPAERKILIAAGRFEELEPPEGIGQPWAQAPQSIPQAPAAKAFRTTVAEVFAREPGQEG